MSTYRRRPVGGRSTLCPKCGTQNEDADRFCLRCGQPLVPNASAYQGNAGYNYGYAPPPYQGYLPNKKSGAVAVILAFFIAGVGHLYAGKYVRGIIILVVVEGIGTVLSFLLYMSIMDYAVGAGGPFMNSTWALIIIGFVAYFIAYVWQMYDAYKAVQEYNRKLPPANRYSWSP